MAAMAGPDVEMGDKERSLVDLERLRRKKFKIAELPVSASQRAAVDSLLYSFKKKGGFDLARKQIWNEFNRNDAKCTFTASLNEMAESELERDSSLLSRERGKAATLVEGAVDRSDLYKSVEAAIDNVASAHLESILSSLRSIRHEEAGGETSLAEKKAGNVTDEDYEHLIREKRVQREQARQTELEMQQQRETEEAKAKAEELQIQREMRKSKDEEERRKHKEREDQRRAEREKLRQERLRLDGQRELERKERYERRRREDGDRYRAPIRTREEQDSCEYDRNRNWRSERERDSRRGKSPATGKADQAGTKPLSREENRPLIPQKSSPSQLNEKSLEDAALELLLKEGKELAEKSRQKPDFDFEQAEALENSQNQQSHPVVGPDSKVSSDSTHAGQAPNTKKEQDYSCIPGQTKRRSSQDDYSRRRDYGRMDANISKPERPPRYSESIGRECKEREPGWREGSDFDMDRYRPPVRDSRDKELVDTHSRRPHGSRSRSVPRSRREGTREHRDRRSDPDRDTDKGVERTKDRSQGNQHQGHDRIKSGDRIRKAGQVMENGDRESDKGKPKDRDRDGDGGRALDRGRYRERAYDRDYGKSWDEERSYRPRRASRSPSRSARRRGRRQSRSEARCRTHTRSPTRRTVNDGHRSDSHPEGCSETPNVLDIDRYVPSTSNRSRSPKRRDRDRDRSRDQDEGARHYDIDRYIPPGKEDLRPSGVNRDEQRRGRSRSR